MNEEIEELFPTQSIIDTSEIVPERVEVIAVNEYGKVDAISLDYNEYRTKLSSFYKMRTVENSIVLTFFVDDSICNHSVTFRKLTGNQEVKEKKIFNYDSSFINTFLIPMVEDYNRENIIFDSTIEVLDENKANFIARTNSNDSLIIMGISIELANQFKDLITRNDMPVSILDKKAIDEKGMSNSLIIILTIIAIGMCLVGIIIFSLGYYRN